MTGDAAMQPVEGVDALDDLADSLLPETKPERAAPEAQEDAEDEQEVEEADKAEDTEEADESDEEEAEEPTFTIKVDGKDVVLKQSELIEKAQKGLDYTNKTMAVAEERKAVEAERTQVSEHRQQAEQTLQETLTRLNAWTEYMQAQVGQMPDTAMLDYDTAGFLRKKEEFEARRGLLQQGYAAQQQLLQEQARSRQAWIQEKAAATEKTLNSTLPGWSNDTLSELSGYAETLGLTFQTADQAMLEPGFWQLAHKAKAYDAIQARKAQMKPTEQLAKVSKPAASNTSGKVAERAKREAAFHKNPSVDALAALLR